MSLGCFWRIIDKSPSVDTDEKLASRYLDGSSPAVHVATVGKVSSGHLTGMKYTLLQLLSQLPFQKQARNGDAAAVGRGWNFDGQWVGID